MNIVRIVAATDFSEHAGNAVHRAAMLARRLGAELELLHVVSRASLDAVREWVREPADFADRLVADARGMLEQAAQAAKASARLAVGDVHDEIASACNPRGILVLGARGLNPVRDAILGTTAERMVGRCDCPILVVRRPPQADYANVLAALDLQPGSETALAAAAASAPGAKKAAVHALDVPFEGALQRSGIPGPQIEQHRVAAFQRGVESIRRLGADLLPIVERGHPARLILEHAHGLGADLIVMAKRTRPAVGALLLGSTTRHVLANADADVLVVPA
jgi:nucleotide-binding universal stress UspA family protein